MSELHLDCCFIREAAEEDYSVMLVGMGRKAHAVRFKGGDAEWVSEQVCRER